MIVMEKNDLRLKFNKEITTKNGFVCSIRLAVKPTKDCTMTIDINALYKKLGHASKALM